MLFHILGSGGFDPVSIIASLLFSLPIILLSLSAHEAAHGWMAYKCGDPTARNLGRLTLNPIKHLDWKGFLCMLVFGYGWANPVPVNTRNFRNPKRGMALTAAAGPAINLLLGIFFSALWGSFSILAYAVHGTFWENVVTWSIILFQTFAYVNVLYAIFNLIPLPPFDGSRIAFVFLPTRIYFSIMRYEQQILIGILVALVVLSRFGFSPFSWLADNLSFFIANKSYQLFLPLLK